MKFSEKMCLKIILKVTKKQGFSLSLEDTVFEKPQSESNWQAILVLNKFLIPHGEGRFSVLRKPSSLTSSFLKLVKPLMKLVENLFLRKT